MTLRFSFWFFAVCALFLLLADRRILLRYFILPVAVHESGHLMAALLLGTGVREIYFTPVSIRIATAQRKTLSYGGELFVAAGGILANLAAALFLRLFLFASMRNMLMTASHLAVAIFNFLPAGSLDGGQIVRIICLRAAGCEAAEKISRAAGLAVLLPLTAAAIYLAARGTVNFTAPVIFGYLALVMIIRER